MTRAGKSESSRELNSYYSTTIGSLPRRSGNRDSVILMVNPATGEEVFRWNSNDDIPMEDVLRNNRQEFAHINSVFVDDDDNFLALLRGTSRVTSSDATGKKVSDYVQRPARDRHERGGSQARRRALRLGASTEAGQSEKLQSEFGPVNVLINNAALQVIACRFRRL